MFVAIGMTTMDLEPAKRKRSTRKDEEKKNIFFSRRSRDLLFQKRDKLFLCKCICVVCCKKAVTALQRKSNNSLKHYTIAHRE